MNATTEPTTCRFCGKPACITMTSFYLASPDPDERGIYQGGEDAGTYSFCEEHWRELQERTRQEADDSRGKNVHFQPVPRGQAKP